MPPQAPIQRIAAQDDLYTTLLIIATVILFLGIIFMVVRSAELFPSILPPAGG